MSDVLELPGNRTEVRDLVIQRAVSFARYVESGINPGISLVGCIQGAEGQEALLIVCHPDVPQRPVNDIRYDEELAVVFALHTPLPDILALRSDFPEVPHLNLRPYPVPKSLCLFIEHPNELAIKWTPALLGERILWWLHETAYGTLHKDDQSLEPFIGGIPRPLIVPSDVFALDITQRLAVYNVPGGPTGEVLVAASPDSPPPGVSTAKFALLPFLLPLQEHGVIRREPETLLELQQLCTQAGFDLLEELAQFFRSNYGTLRPELSGCILMLAIPKSRRPGSDAEGIDFFGFRCFELVSTQSEPLKVLNISFGRLGEMLGLLGRTNQAYVPLFNSSPKIEGNAASSVKVQLLVPLSMATPETASRMSGLGQRHASKVLAIGVGALGSHVITNLAREGFGQWTLVDSDYIAPHNVVRHAILGNHFGQPKSQEMAKQINAMFSGEPIASFIDADVVHPDDQKEALDLAAQQADIILDLSASVAVARHIALDVKYDAKRMSVFLNPTATDLVAMSEGDSRSVTLDSIEAQYLRAVINDDKLRDHIAIVPGHVRFGASCRDVSARIPQERVALFSAVGARAVRQFAIDAAPALYIWQCNPDTMTVERIVVPLAPAIVESHSEWTVITDEALMQKLHSLRSSKLPNETCGVLLGYFDTLRSRLYICDVLSAPNDSVEEAAGCRRGIDGLAELVSQAAARTRGQVEYVGEWHSHPNGVPCSPSVPDIRQVDWLSDRMQAEGKPALMLIACEQGVCIHVSGQQTRNTE